MVDGLSTNAYIDPCLVRYVMYYTPPKFSLLLCKSIYVYADSEGDMVSGPP